MRSGTHELEKTKHGVERGGLRCAQAGGGRCSSHCKKNAEEGKVLSGTKLQWR